MLTQVTNSFVPNQLAEGKLGEMMFSQDSSTSNSTISKGPVAPTLKKASVAADPKKKWMRRI